MLSTGDPRRTATRAGVAQALLPVLRMWQSAQRASQKWRCHKSFSATDKVAATTLQC